MGLGTAREGEVLWVPDPARRGGTRVAAYLRFLAGRGLAFADYADLHAWSVADLPAFWQSIWDHFAIDAASPYRQILDDRPMPRARWLVGARLNYAAHALRSGADDAPALVWRSEARGDGSMTWRELRQQVGSVRAWFTVQGVGEGDRVAGYLPNGPEAVVAFLAAASLGSVWSCCPPDFGPTAALDRLAQISPCVLIAADGAVYAGRSHDRRTVVAHLAENLPGLRRVLRVDHLGLWHAAGPVGNAPAAPWSDAVSSPQPPTFTAVPADHPLWVLYSSGTTGPPKAIVHGHGGMLLEHLKAAALHMDLGPGRRFTWLTSTGWMMWNVVVSSLLVGATAHLFDGSPLHPDPGAVWRWVGERRITDFGTSAAHLQACMRAGVVPQQVADLSALTAVGSTGSPLSAEGFAWVYRCVSPQVWLASISGGTDVCSGLLGGCPLLPVRAGEIQAPMLGVAVAAFDPHGRPVKGVMGELVVTRPMPSMPIGFWNDPDGRRYEEAYFSTFPCVWRHGDWVRLTPSGGAVIAGRSDATLNRNGVRLGTAEIYRVVEAMPGVSDSLVVDVPRPGGRQVMVLFVVVRDGGDLDAGDRERIRTALRQQLSPRHVPDVILAVPGVPRTLSGKKVEVPVRRILAGEAAEDVANASALTDPAALEPFRQLALHPERWEGTAADGG